MSEPLKCVCGEVLGKLEGNWYVYPSPMVCPKCGADFTDAMLLHMMKPKGVQRKKGGVG